MALPLFPDEAGLFCTSYAADVNHKSRTRASIGKNSTISNYPKAVNYLQRAYATVKNITDSKDDTNIFIKSSNKNPCQYAEALVATKFCFEDVDREQDFYEIFTKELDKSVRRKMRKYWST